MTEDERQLLRALAGMCVQYIGGISKDGNYLGLDHQCMVAGEDAVELLVKFGLVSPSGRGGTWTDTGVELLESR